MADRSMAFSPPEVRAIMSGTKTQHREPFSRRWTVLDSVWGRNAPWSGLDFAKATVGTLSGMGLPDAHLHVPWVHPEDAAAGMTHEENGSIYRVRPPFEIGDRLWVREACRAEELSRPQQTRPATKLEQQRFGRTTVIECSELDGVDGVRYLADDVWSKIENTQAAGDAWSALFHYRGRGKDRCGTPVPSIHMPRWASRLTLDVTDVRVQRLQDISEADALAEGVDRLRYPEIGDWGWPQERFHRLWDSIHGADAWEANPWICALTFCVHHGNIDAVPAEAEVAHA